MVQWASTIPWHDLKPPRFRSTWARSETSHAQPLYPGMPRDLQEVLRPLRLIHCIRNDLRPTGSAFVAIEVFRRPRHLWNHSGPLCMLIRHDLRPPKLSHCAQACLETPQASQTFLKLTHYMHDLRSFRLNHGTQTCIESSQVSVEASQAQACLDASQECVCI